MSKALATKNVAAVLLTAAMVLGFAFSFATPAKADVISDLNAQVQALLAQIAALQGGGSQQVGGLQCSATFTQNLKVGATGGEVMAVQKFLNSVDGTQVAVTGAGSPGNETSYFGPATKAAVIKFQNKFAADILTPVGLSAGNGNWFASTRAKANALCAGSPTNPGNPIPSTGNLMISAGAQPANSLAPKGASRVPFTTFTLSNGSSAAVTVNQVTVQKTGLGDKAAFDGVVLVDANGIQLGNPKTFNSNNQAMLDAMVTLQPGQTMTFTVAGNMASDLTNYAGQVISISVVGVNTAATVSGSLPITGAAHTLNNTLTVGGLQVSVGPTDPNTTALNSSTAGKEIGTTGFVFASIRAQNTGSAEDEWIKSIRWNQAGSASGSDLANIVTVVDGTSYPTTISADGKYYTTVFPGNGIQVQKGLQKEIIVKGDIVGGPNRTIEFDLYKAADIYVVGGTYGYGITPTANTTSSVTDASQFTTGTPFFSGSVVQVNAGTVSSVSRATEVPAQNIVLLSPNQPLGGFAVDIKGESITVASMTFGFNIGDTEDATNIDNITLVDENGAVVAGPVDGQTGVGTDGKVTFTDSVTFKTGRHVYTLKGQLDSSFESGDTIQATTTPASYWSNVRGETTGNSITLTNAEVSGNQMTVRAGSLILSIASQPAAQTVVSGVSGQTVSGINFDATQSGEDVRFSSAKFKYSDSISPSGVDVTNCYAYDGATRLNSSAVNPTTNAAEYTFIFDTQLIVTKGTVKAVTIKCDIPASATGGSFSFGFADQDGDTTNTITGTGVTSSQTVYPISSNGSAQNGNSMAIAGNGALTVTKDASSPSYTVVAAGTSGVTLGQLRFTGTNEAMRLDRVALQMSNSSASSSPNDLVQVYLYDGATQVGTAIFAGTRFATSTLTGTVTIPANGYKILTVKGDLAPIGTNQSGTEGALIQIDYDNGDSTGTRAIGQSSGQTIDRTSTADSAVDGVRMFRSYPVVAKLNVPTTVLTTGTVDLYRFSVTANAAGDVGLKLITVNLSTSSASTANGTTSVANLKVYGYTDSSFSQGVPGFTSGALNATGITPSNSGDQKVAFDSTVEIPAGQTYYFKVQGDVTQAAGTTGSAGSITTRLSGDAAYPSLSTLMGYYATTLGNFIWSPNATTTSLTTNQDWTNGYGIAGLPSGGTDATTLTK